MPVQLYALSFDAHDPERLAGFWSGLLGWETVAEPDGGFALLPADDTGFRIEFYPSEEPMVVPNQIHFDLTSNLEDQQAIVARALRLGGRHIDVGQPGGGARRPRRPRRQRVLRADAPLIPHL
ncbi:hypothetical protein D0Z08_13955 [Nocardioides immobilis]|uniref:Glyoxalase-like domain-containing protein n=1 Tax=Nocardioides immobilis TaxID=2049295 RepID=A0A417Y1F9_9ACTN|nr:VOC family protein [Nocardioides immobilis]RHW26435.1 hypothetical protein D0Z08_13955 [Nocardioides immobilis]